MISGRRNSGHFSALRIILALSLILMFTNPFSIVSSGDNSDGGNHIGYTLEAIHTINIGDDREYTIISFSDSGEVLATDGRNVYAGILNRNKLTLDNTIFKANGTVLDLSMSPNGEKALLLIYMENYSGHPANSIEILTKDGISWGSNAERTEIYWNYEEMTGIYHPVWLENRRIAFYMDFSTRPKYAGIYTIDGDGKNLTKIMSLLEIPTDLTPTPDQHIAVSLRGEALWYVDNGTQKDISSFHSYYWGRDFRIFGDGRIFYLSSIVSPQDPYLHGAEGIWMKSTENSSSSTVIVPGKTIKEMDVLSSIKGYFVQEDMKRIFFYTGNNGTKVYYVEDPTGKWNDTDGDGVWDGVDGAPYNPQEGYYRREPMLKEPHVPSEFVSPPGAFLLLYTAVIILFFVLAILVVLFFVHVARKTYVKIIPPPYYSDQNVRTDRCPFCGSAFVEKNGRRYCERCRIYF